MESVTSIFTLTLLVLFTFWLTAAVPETDLKESVRQCDVQRSTENSNRIMY